MNIEIEVMKLSEDLRVIYQNLLNLTSSIGYCRTKIKLILESQSSQDINYSSEINDYSQKLNG